MGKEEFDNLDLKRIFEELKEDPLHKFNIAFSLMSIIPILGFMYILLGELFSFKILEGNIGFIVFVSILISLLGFFAGHAIIRNLISRTIKYMAKLKENDRQKSIFVANVSHEIKNPLSIIKLALANILDGIIGNVDERMAEVIRRCKDLCDRLIRFTTDMLDIAKIEAGRIDLKRASVELNSLIEEEIKNFGPAFDKKKLSIDYNQSLPKINIWADRDKLLQVFYNLIDNAIKYTPEHGKILINLLNEDKYARIEICDTGLGIPDDKMEKVFDKFERVSAEHEGTGLGLPIVKDIIELHKGRIWIESKLNEGSRFVVLLPKDLRVHKRLLSL